MQKLFNDLAIVVGVIGGVIDFLFGDCKALICLLAALMVVDWITGLIKSNYSETTSSKIGFKGAAKKGVMILLIMSVHFMQTATGDLAPVCEITTMFFAVNELLSIIENAAGVGLPIPKKLKKILLQIRNANDDEGE